MNKRHRKRELHFLMPFIDFAFMVIIIFVGLLSIAYFVPPGAGVGKGNMKELKRTQNKGRQSEEGNKKGKEIKVLEEKIKKLEQKVKVLSEGKYRPRKVVKVVPVRAPGSSKNSPEGANRPMQEKPEDFGPHAFTDLRTSVK